MLHRWRIIQNIPLSHLYKQIKKHYHNDNLLPPTQTLCADPLKCNIKKKIEMDIWPSIDEPGKEKMDWCQWATHFCLNRYIYSSSPRHSLPDRYLCKLQSYLSSTKLWNLLKLQAWNVPEDKICFLLNWLNQTHDCSAKPKQILGSVSTTKGQEVFFVGFLNYIHWILYYRNNKWEC